MEIHFDNKHNEKIKMDILYDEWDTPKEQFFYINSQLHHRETYKYENDLLIEVKGFLPNQEEAETVKTWKYDESGKLLEYNSIIDKDIYTKQYKYDQQDNEIEKKELKNKKVISIGFTDIEYYQE
jgi:hypothetical protein